MTANGLDHTVSYDGAGNETGYYAARSYSSRNLMNSVTDTSGEGPAHTVSYGYDYRGVRVSRTETPTDAVGFAAKAAVVIALAWLDYEIWKCVKTTFDV